MIGFRSSRYARIVAVATLAAAFTAVPAQAQFGKMIKKAAQGAVQGATENAANKAVGGNNASTAAGGRPAIAISADNIDKLLGSLKPMMTAAQNYTGAKAQYEAAKAKYDAAQPRARRHQECRDSIQQLFPMAGMPNAQTIEGIQRAQEQMQAVMTRQQAAVQAGNSARAQLLADSVGVMAEQMQNVMVPALKNCGAYVSSPIEPHPPRNPNEMKPAIPDGMTPVQFGQLRERVAAWLLTNGRYKVSEEEATALTARKADLDTLTPLFRGGALIWSNWSDVVD